MGLGVPGLGMKIAVSRVQSSGASQNLSFCFAKAALAPTRVLNLIVS